MPDSFDKICQHFNLDKRYWPYVEIHIQCPALRTESGFVHTTRRPLNQQQINVAGKGFIDFYQTFDIDILNYDVVSLPKCSEGETVNLILPRLNLTIYFGLCNTSGGKQFCRNNIYINGLDELKSGDYVEYSPDLLCY